MRGHRLKAFLRAAAAHVARLPAQSGPPGYPVRGGLCIFRQVAGISPMGPVNGAGAVTVAWIGDAREARTSSVRLSLSNRADRWPAAPLGFGRAPALASQSSAGSFTKVRKKSSTCRIASVNRSRLTGLVMYALACSR